MSGDFASDAHAGDKRAEQRRSPRVPYRSLARLQLRRGDEGFDAEVHNISSTGMFVISDHVPAPGARVECHLFLGIEPWVLKGKVVWVRPDWRPDGTRAPAAGIEFVDLSLRDTRALDSAVAESVAVPGASADHAEHAGIESPAPAYMLRALSSSSAERVVAPPPPPRFHPVTGIARPASSGAGWIGGCLVLVAAVWMWWSWTAHPVSQTPLAALAGPRVEPASAMIAVSAQVDPEAPVETAQDLPPQKQQEEVKPVAVQPVQQKIPHELPPQTPSSLQPELPAQVPVVHAAEAKSPDRPFVIRRGPRARFVWIPILGGVAGGHAYTLSDPPGAAVNLPHARPEKGPGARGRFQTDEPGVRSVWVEMRGDLLHARVLTDADTHVRRTLMEPTGIRFVLDR